MTSGKRRLIIGSGFLIIAAIVGWSYYQSLVPAIHPDHDHGLENLAGGGFLRVEHVEGGRRNLVGRPGRVLLLHWFEPGSHESAEELPLLIDYASSVEKDPGVEVVIIAISGTRESLLQWAHSHGVPTRLLYVDPQGKTAGLIGVRRLPETLIYDPEGRLAHQTRGAVDWSAASARAAIQGFKHRGHDEHDHEH